jgi:hypothetical protein
MRDFSLYNNLNKKKEIGAHTPGIPTIRHFIDQEKWLNYINSNSAFFWYIDAPIGQLDKNHPEYPLDLKYYYCRAFWEYSIKLGYSDTVIECFDTRICFQFPSTTIKRLEMMWAMAKALDCHLVMGNSNIIDEKNFLKLKEKYASSTQKNKDKTE